MFSSPSEIKSVYDLFVEYHKLASEFSSTTKFLTKLPQLVISTDLSKSAQHLVVSVFREIMIVCNTVHELSVKMDVLERAYVQCLETFHHQVKAA